ncbi:TetR/AcrR family transcriptional regulator [Paracidovorax wautersii]|jgi:AcrR family transcriptional regulator|uniref:DNA-binding transcriptional regulator, AcrR family n=1 Tax=Paracidovorax wautersii TaxID=1177982 RepID=A0A1I2DZV1_9BURK|nr:TetR/AcrR family transcriptional regulator [Paracidovorax wautersii]GAO20750.1 transcriptional regulator [Alicycliphilus sp. B1]SFE85947.1 DNA-binding transcriptional regulator, AcrR family [Paracidovorax wautersii]
MKRARELLEVATELFLSKGIDETTIDDIAAHAGIAKGTFYHHYESKAALLLAIRESVSEDFDGHIESELAKQRSDDPVVRLETWVRATCDAYAMIIRRQDIGFAGAGFRWTPREQPHIKDLVALLEAGNTRGSWKVKDLYRTAIFVQKGMLGVMDDMVLAGKSLKGVHKDLVDLVRQAVGRS